jgi:Protein of unknown function (DUF3110)
MQVYVLLYNARTENEGIHSIQIGDRNIILMFESEDDATRYALLLEAQDFMSPTVEVMDAEEIEDFCQSSGYSCQPVPQGFIPNSDEERLLLAPPETNRLDLDWQPEGEAAEPSETIPDSELEQIRRRLEGLL